MNASRLGRYATRAGALLAPRERLLPGLGAWLQRRPRLAVLVLAALRRAPAGRPRAAAFRNLSRPLTRRMDARLEVPVAGGSRMIVDTGDLLGSVLAVSGVWEPHVTAAFRRLLSAGDVCIDVGAHIGYFTLLASRLVRPSGHVYAYEPGPRAYAALRANLDLNRSTNVTAVEAAAGEVEGEAQLDSGKPGNWASASLLGLAAGSTPVAVRRVDSSVRADDLPRVRLVKIDVEGYELEVLKGLDGLFAVGARPAIVVEVTPALSGDDGYLSAFCAEHGLKAHRLADPGLFAADDWELRLEPLSGTGERHELLLLPAESPLGRGR